MQFVSCKNLNSLKFHQSACIALCIHLLWRPIFWFGSSSAFDAFIAFALSIEARSDSDSDSDEVYEVERILGKRMQDTGLEYQVHWKGYGQSDDTWEPANSLGDSKAAVAAYEKSKPKSPE